MQKQWQQIFSFKFTGTVSQYMDHLFISVVSASELIFFLNFNHSGEKQNYVDTN
jgi:hypothetical protein